MAALGGNQHVLALLASKPQKSMMPLATTWLSILDILRCFQRHLGRATSFGAPWPSGVAGSHLGKLTKRSLNIFRGRNLEKQNLKRKRRARGDQGLGKDKTMILFEASSVIDQPKVT
ncbi:hypothetical protein KFL_001560160 [Klebsormidium nitens]|uniref:Uncharacterized protein n=1 Tax=Klebsormidium nitens TaxID=105231 RepID=A0A1Y1I4I0_KLENI|nr:hypothetical protein KFL_001560160 [Klebsormidium nitens]|eukprot:GAQ83647.1 hypothetical protein KFL_001560160 [Klebsormidium nitens]